VLYHKREGKEKGREGKGEEMGRKRTGREELGRERKREGIEGRRRIKG
jgi:hypothetical protein